MGLRAEMNEQLCTKTYTGIFGTNMHLFQYFRNKIMPVYYINGHWTASWFGPPKFLWSSMRTPHVTLTCDSLPKVYFSQKPTQSYKHRQEFLNTVKMMLIVPPHVCWSILRLCSDQNDWRVWTPWSGMSPREPSLLGRILQLTPEHSNFCPEFFLRRALLQKFPQLGILYIIQ